MRLWAGLPFFHGAVGRALGGLNIWKSSLPKACDRVWVSFVSSQAVCAMLHHLVDKFWERLGATDVLKSTVKDIMGVLDEIVAIRD